MKKQNLLISFILLLMIGCTPFKKADASQESASTLSSISVQGLPDGVSPDHSFLEIESVALNYNKKFFLKDIQSNEGIQFEPGTYTFSTFLYDSKKQLVGKNIDSNKSCGKQTFVLKPGTNNIRLVVCKNDGELVAVGQSNVGISGIDIVDQDDADKNAVYESLDVFLTALIKEMVEIESITEIEAHVGDREVAIDNIILTDNAKDFGSLRHSVTVNYEGRDFSFRLIFTGNEGSLKRYEFNRDTKLKVTGRIDTFSRSSNTFVIGFDDCTIQEDK